MLKLAPATEEFQHFVSNLRESFWGDLNDRTREAWQKFFEADSERQRDRFAVVDAYERNAEQRRDYRNGYYERDFVTVLGTLRLRIARTRGQSFLPAGLEAFQRRAPEGINADSGSLFARHQHPSGRTSSSDRDWRSGQCADGLEADARFG
jgi:hypothetical protein